MHAQSLFSTIGNDCVAKNAKPFQPPQDELMDVIKDTKVQNRCLPVLHSANLSGNKIFDAFTY